MSGFFPLSLIFLWILGSVSKFPAYLNEPQLSYRNSYMYQCKIFLNIRVFFICTHRNPFCFVLFSSHLKEASYSIPGKEPGLGFHPSLLTLNMCWRATSDGAKKIKSLANNKDVICSPHKGHVSNLGCICPWKPWTSRDKTEHYWSLTPTHTLFQGLLGTQIVPPKSEPPLP